MPRSVQSALHTLSHRILSLTPSGRFYNCPRFTDEKTDLNPDLSSYVPFIIIHIFQNVVQPPCERRKRLWGSMWANSFSFQSYVLFQCVLGLGVKSYVFPKCVY